MTHARKLAFTVAIAVVLAAGPLAAGVKIKVQYDKAFNFEGLKTYAWRLDGANPIKILENTQDNPEEIRKNVEPMILEIADLELAKKGFKRVTSGQPDLYLDYYVLVGPGVSSQYQGQFIGAVPAWGLPDFVMATTALTVFEQGSVIIDVVSVAQKQTVWRGAADAKVDRRRTKDERAAVVGMAVVDMFKNFPPKFKKK